MKRIYFLLAGVLLCCSPAFAVDLTLKGGAGNMAFDQDRTSFLNDKKFEPNYFPFGLIQLDGVYADFINYRIGFDRDPVLRNRIITNISFNFEYIHLDIGPFIGPFNTRDRVITPGISAGFAAEWPGILFGRLTAGSTVGAGLNAGGDYVQQNGEIAFGFWAPYVINTLSASLRSFTEQTGGGKIEDRWIRYQYTADVFSKNVPYTVHIDMGYQTLERSYSAGGTDTLKSVFLGFETTVRINPMVKVLLGAEMPVYSWGEKPLGNPGRTVLFQAHTGVVLSFVRKQI
ncbi:MAG: hypothetical protein LBQ14_05895 [Treponema sp.]|jgi:hypothetical protein|nr:hypothetical protein [Treponema sp.]